MQLTLINTYKNSFGVGVVVGNHEGKFCVALAKFVIRSSSVLGDECIVVMYGMHLCLQ